YHPSVIGLDLFRDLPVPMSGAELPRLNEVLLRHTNIIAIRRFALQSELGIPPPPILKDLPERVGINDIPYDAEIDDHVRRAFISLGDSETNNYFSLGVQLALEHLKRYRIFPEQDPDGHGYMMLGNYVFVPLSKHDGGYVHMDDRGYQLLLDFKGPKDF